MMKSFPASLDRLYDMLRHVRTHALAAGFEYSPTLKIELAAEEALVNIISYGYIDRVGCIDITCDFIENQEIKIIIRDEGIPYNPLSYEKIIDITAPLESRPIGGYGIFFMRKIMDKIDYERDGDYNVLILIKYIIN